MIAAALLRFASSPTLGPNERGQVMGRLGLLGSSYPRARKVISSGILLVVLGTLLLMTVPALAACAQAGPNCHGRYRGLKTFLNEDPGQQLLGELDYDPTDATSTYNKNRRVTGDPNGDRQQVEGRFTDRAPNNGNDVFVTSVWWRNGNHCFTDLVAISAGKDEIGVQIGVSCSVSWTEDGDQDQTAHHGAQTWKYFTTPIQHPFDPTGNALRVQIWICEAQAFVPDDCTVAPRLLGIKY